MEKRYIGIFNYTKDELPLTSMVAFSSNKEEVEKEISKDSKMNIRELSDYHIAEYECISWDIYHPDIPRKVAQYTM